MPERRQAPRKLQHDQVPHHVGLDVDVRIGHRLANAGLGSEVDYPVDLAMSVGQRQHRLAVGDIEFEEGEGLAVTQWLHPGELQDRIVVRAEIVDSQDRLAPRQQGMRDLATDEAGHAGDQNGHELWAADRTMNAPADYNVSPSNGTLKRRTRLNALRSRKASFFRDTAVQD